MARGKFITIEGGEGAGKSTQVALLAAALRADGIEVATSREPGGTAGAEEIRRLLVEGATDRWHAETETLLLFAARDDHLRRIVRPALARGTWLVCDRFVDSTRAYQGHGQGAAQALIDSLEAAVVGEDKPDLTLVLDLPIEVATARAIQRPGALARYERMGQAFHARVRQGFLEIARQEPGRCIVIDATLPLERVTAEIKGAVWRRLGLSAARSTEAPR